MNIALFGSAFNPPHLGHALVIQDFLEAGLTDEVWLLPNVKHNFGKHMAEPKHRLEMTTLFLEFLKQSVIRNSKFVIRLCPIELDLHLSGQTYDTLQALKSNPKYLTNIMHLTNYQLPITSYSFLMGSDQLPHFHEWGHYQELLQEMHFYVYPRAGYQDGPLLPNMELYTTNHQTITNLSSTLIRHRLASGKNLELLLPPDIITYIHTNHLYQTI